MMLMHSALEAVASIAAAIRAGTWRHLCLALLYLRWPGAPADIAR